MLLKQIDSLDYVSCELRKINSLLTLLGDYFGRLDPKGWELQCRYETYQDLVSVVGDIVNVQKKCIDDASGKLSTIRDELKRLGELI